MPKGYWIGRVDVSNDEGYKPYSAANAAIFRKYGGRFVVRAGKYEAVEGASRSRNVVIEFPDYATALACYRSPEYQAQPQSAAAARDCRHHRDRGLRRAAAVAAPSPRVPGEVKLLAFGRPAISAASGDDFDAGGEY
jgi:uncharacterized protein (DUF1330 family)